MNDILIKLRWLLTAVALVLVVLIVLQLWADDAESDDATMLVRASASPLADGSVDTLRIAPSVPDVAVTAEPALIAVDVIGAVAQPGLYWLPAPARVDDAIKAAGGWTPDVDREAVNLAATVADGEQIRVPRVGEAAPFDPSPSAAPSSVSQPALININTADATALDSLPGIGPATAQAIIEYRTTNGPFGRIEEIEDVSGIGPALFNKIKALIVVGS